ncbi:MAG: AMP-binding protein [Chloroflexi bacterium]|nr:AMP-binding protein [Chloroflexota bacterium]
MIPADANTLTDAIKACATTQPEGVIATFLTGDRTTLSLTYEQLHTQAQQLATRLAVAGIGPEDVVVLAGEHNPSLIALLLAAMYTGATPIVAPYPSVFKQASSYYQRVLTIVETCQAHAIVALSDTLDHFAQHLGDSRCIVLEYATLAGMPTPDSPPKRPLSISTPSSPAYVQLTSGTTGTPKGAVVSQAAVLHHLRNLVAVLRLSKSDVLVGWTPFYHDLGLVLNLLLPLASGVPVVTISPDYWVRQPRTLLQAIHDYRGTVCAMPNFGFSHMTRNVRLRDGDELDLGCIRYLLAGTEVVQKNTLDAFTTRFKPFGVTPEMLRVGYGMAESVLTASLTPDSVPLRVDHIRRQELLTQGRAIPTNDSDALSVVSCGISLPQTTITVIDEQGSPLPERQIGEIAIESPAMFERYLYRPDLTQQALQHGRLLTGDLGYLADNELYVVDRKKDLIISAGRNIYPEALEQPALDVLGDIGGRAVAFGIRSPDLGTELPVLVCELRRRLPETERDQLASEILRRVHRHTSVALADVRFVRRGWVEITTSGKVARAATRDRYLAEGFRPEHTNLTSPLTNGLDPASMTQALITLAEKMLDLPDIKPEDNLFELGSDSLTVARLTLYTEKELGAHVGPEFFQNPTISHLVHLLAPEHSSVLNQTDTQPQGGSSLTPRRSQPKAARRDRIAHTGPIVRGHGLPYGIGIHLQRAWLAIPSVRQRLFTHELALLRRWSELVGEQDGDEAIARSLLANTWTTWRSRVLAGSLGASPWIVVEGDSALLQPRLNSPGTIFLVMHSHLSTLLVRYLAYHGDEPLFIRGKTGDGPSSLHDRSLQLHCAYRNLMRGEPVIIAADGGKGQQGVTVPFFGGKRMFRSGGAELAVQTKAPLVPVFGVMGSDGRITFELCQPLSPSKGASESQVEALTGEYAELVVRRWPSIYTSLAWGNLDRWLKRLDDGVV